MSSWIDEYLQLVEDCEKRSARLTDWESGFIDSMRRQLESERPPTPRQIEVLDQTWERVTARG